MSGGGDKAAGMKTALAELLMGSERLPSSDAAQVDMFAPDDFGDDLPGSIAPIVKSGPQGGRPKGARNKSTEQLREYIARQYKHPLIVLAEMWSRTPKELAEEMGLYELKVVSYGDGGGSHVEKYLATGEAARLQQQAMIAALPYLAQKMPIAIEQKIKQMGVLLLGNFKRHANPQLDGLLLSPEDGDDVQIKGGRSPLGGDPE